MLASGSFANGGEQDFTAGTGSDALDAVAVVPGDELYLTIGPRGGWGYDGTVVDFAVIEPSAADLDVNSTDDRVDVRPGDWICSTGEVVSGAAGDEPECTLRAAIRRPTPAAGPTRSPSPRAPTP